VVRGNDATVDTFVQMAEAAEVQKWHCLWASDHLIMPEMKTSRYPGRADGELPPDWKKTYYQPFSVLNFLAGHTTSVRLGMSVLILPMRNPIEVAAQVAEMDQLSTGRVNFGVGVGWYREEFEALGYDFTNRGRRTNDGLAIIKSLWAAGKTTMDGPYYNFINAETGPKPFQRPGPPIYIGGNTPAALSRLAQFGDAWHPYKISPDDLRESIPVLREALEKAGRTTSNFPIAVKVPLTFQDGPPMTGQCCTEGRPQDIIEGLKRYIEEGATEFCFDIMNETRVNALDTMSRFTQEVRPHLS
jgi:probable F420-dependent oxidoreductase